MSEKWQQQGNVLDVLESDLVHPTHADGLADVGDPVTFGTANMPGVAHLSAGAATDLVPVGVNGVYRLSVAGKGDAGAGEVDEAVVFGDKLYYDSGVINRDEINGSFFGIALGAVASGNTGTVIPVTLGGPQA